MTCPNCGKALAPSDILVPVFDKSGKVLFTCFHLDETLFRDFIAALEKNCMTFEDFIRAVTREEKRRSGATTSP